MTTIATICARGGSTELPRKNILPLAGKPLIVHTIEQALDCPLIDSVFVSTDDEEIAKIAKKAGAAVPFLRPKELATKEAAKHPAILHCVEWIINEGIPVTRIVDLDPTAPIRSKEDIKNALELLTDETDVVFSVYETDKNPYFNLIELNTAGFAKISKLPENPVVARQQAPKVYAINGSIYAWHIHSLQKGLWGGRAKVYVMPKERSIDINSAIDFKLVELLYSELRINEHENFVSTECR